MHSLALTIGITLCTLFSGQAQTLPANIDNTTIQAINAQPTFEKKLALVETYLAQGVVNKAGGEYDNPWVNNVPEKFNNISANGSLSLAFKYTGGTPAFTDAGCRYTECYRHNGKAVGPGGATQGLINFLGYGLIGGFKNHFQGIARGSEWLGLGQYIFVAGNNPHADPGFGPQSHLFIVKMGAQPATGLFSTNNALTYSRNNVIQSVKNLTADFPGYIHPGGIQICGKYLVVAIESADDEKNAYPGKIAIYQITKDQVGNIVLIKEPAAITMPTGTAMAAGITRLADGRYLIVCTNGSFLYYCSRDGSIASGFDLVGITPGDGQSINFINDTDGSLYLVRTYNDNPNTPYKKWPVDYRGTDFAILYKVEVPSTIQPVSNKNPSGGFKLIQIGQPKAFAQPKENYNFSAAAGIYVSNQNSLVAYSSSHWLNYDARGCVQLQMSPLSRSATNFRNNARRNAYMNIVQFA
ncbi:MAG: hypothetical protein WCW33_01195 [Candidatus Babeliales bacterium]|jgi:hypothetical protein